MVLSDQNMMHFNFPYVILMNLARISAMDICLLYL